jgi:hypothetical protein
VSDIKRIANEIGELTEVKNKAYGDSVRKSGEVLRIFFPDGIKPDQYDDVMLITRMLDKVCRIATDKDALGESPYRDLAGYSIMGVVKDEAKKKNSVKEYPCNTTY